MKVVNLLVGISIPDSWTANTLTSTGCEALPALLLLPDAVADGLSVLLLPEQPLSTAANTVASITKLNRPFLKADQLPFYCWTRRKRIVLVYR
ncbi:hypothetical protein D3C80_1827030 [compost metagenome]